MIKLHLRFAVFLTALSAVCPFACRADLPTLTVLHTFSPGGPGDLTPSHDANQDGAKPEAPLVQGPDGAFYGTTPSGGAHGTGVIFKINADGTGFIVLHSFGPLDALFTNDANADGCRPTGAIVIGKDGALYGVAGQGGPKGSGTVFTLNKNGSGFKVLHSFEAKGDLYHNDGGADPLGLTVGPGQTLYGVAELGGEGRGLVFKMTQDGKEFHVLHTFDDATYNGSVNVNDGGAIPSAAVIIGDDGALYGTTNIGGREGYGVIYKIEVGSRRCSILHNFRRKDGDYKNNGAFPDGPLRKGPNHFLYGCTRQGGASDGGIVYKISQDGTAFTVLRTFSDPYSDNENGDHPAGPLAFGTDGYLYGLSGGGGEAGAGTLFKVTLDGAKFFTLHDFTIIEGGYTRTGLTLGRDGNLYGVSTNGGANKTGTIFRVTFPAAK